MRIRHVVLNKLSVVIFLCVTTSQLVGQNTDSLNLAKESQHFNFYSTTGDIKVLDSLATALENNYFRITDNLGIQIDKKINVRVFPNVQAFHLAINYPDAPDWFVGICNGDELMMVSPLNPGRTHTYESLMQVVVHEFAHVAVNHARADKSMDGFPRWLNEGYACHEAGQISENQRKSLKSRLADKTLPTWMQLEKASDIEFGSMSGYLISETIVDFLIVTFGIDKLSILIKEPENIETIYGLSKDILESRWTQHIEAY